MNSATKCARRACYDVVRRERSVETKCVWCTSMNLHQKKSVNATFKANPPNPRFQLPIVDFARRAIKKSYQRTHRANCDKSISTATVRERGWQAFRLPTREAGNCFECASYDAQLEHGEYVVRNGDELKFEFPGGASRCTLQLQLDVRAN